MPPEWVEAGVWSLVVKWIRGLSWIVVGPVAGVGFFVVFRRFHVGEFFFFFDIVLDCFIQIMCLFLVSSVSFFTFTLQSY